MSMKTSILSSRAAQADTRIKTNGKIRSGIKVLNKTAAANPTACALYDKGVAARLKFNEIERQITAATGITQSMYPRNTAYFNVSSSDFAMPELANLIVQRFGEVREEHSLEKQLYRFPVVFHSDDLAEIYPNMLKRYGGEPGYESHYGEDGERYCRYLPAVTAEQLAHQKTNRFKRAPRRAHVIRSKCDPNTCNEFLQGQCRFRGRLHFYIPGIPTTGLLSMETTSEYAAETIWSDLERIHKALGCIPRANPNKPGANIFYLTKVLEERAYFDGDGKRQTGYQWVPKLQADIDLGGLLTNGVSLQLAKDTTPVAWLSAPKGMPEARTMSPSEIPNGAQGTATQRGNDPVKANSDLAPLDQLEEVVATMGLEDEEVASYFDQKLGDGWLDDDGRILSGIKLLSDLSRVGSVCAAHLIYLSNKVHTLEVPFDAFYRYATRKYGKGFTNKEESLVVIRRDMDYFGSMEPGAFAKEVKATLADETQPA